MMWRRRLVLGAALAGVALLVGSLAGAASLLPANATTVTGATPPATVPLGPPPSVLCNGTVDIDGGLIPLVPALSMPVPAVRVAEVFPAGSEGNVVAAGEPLLRLHNEIAEQSVAEAEAAVAEAKVKVREAEQAIAVHAKLVAVQEAVIKAKQAEVKAAETGLERLRRAGAVTQELQMREAQEKVDALRTGVEAEERKLDQLQAAKPTTKVDEANAAVKRFEVKVTQARVARDEYTLKAPVEGEIIRSMVEPGVAFTAQSRQPAFWFRPKAAKLIIRAEIDQEFANRVKAGLAAEAEDETDPTARWKAKVTRLGQAFLPRRTGPFGESLMSEPTRTLEAILQLQDIGENPPRIGQKVRVTIQ